EEAQPDVRLAGKLLHHGLSESRFADARLAGDEHDLAFARFHLLPAPHQQRHLLLATDQRRRGRAQRLEPAFNRACPQRGPGMYRLRNTLNFLAPNVPELEQIAEKFSRALRDDYRVRLGNRLEARREIRRLADNTAFLRLPRSDQVADNNKSSRNADT